MKGITIIWMALLCALAVSLSPSLAADAVYQTKLFDDGKARFYQFKTDQGITIRYFVLRSSDGVIRAAFDACDVCWRANKGYEQKGDFMVCRNCGRKFLSTKVNEVAGGCNPGPLKREVSGGTVTIREKDIREGARYFDFKGGRS